MSILIGLTAQARSGKDSAADILAARQGLTRLSFAHPIRAFVASLIGLSVEEMEAVKEVPHPALGGKTPRQVMQSLGTDWGRDMVSRSLWIDACMVKVYRALSDNHSVVITDVRFDDEAQAIKAAGGVIYAVHRPGNKGTTSGKGHVSEDGISDDLIDLTIRNSGSLGDLETQVIRAFQHAKMLQSRELEVA